MPGRCRLLAGPEAVTAQFLLAGIALIGLFYKRYESGKGTGCNFSVAEASIGI